jgi:hypothetical protein
MGAHRDPHGPSRVKISEFTEGMVEAPPGFEPGVEVLQCGRPLRMRARICRFRPDSRRLNVIASNHDAWFLTHMVIQMVIPIAA